LCLSRLVQDGWPNGGRSVTPKTRLRRRLVINQVSYVANVLCSQRPAIGQVRSRIARRWDDIVNEGVGRPPVLHTERAPSGLASSACLSEHFVRGIWGRCASSALRSKTCASIGTLSLALWRCGIASYVSTMRRVLAVSLHIAVGHDSMASPTTLRRSVISPRRSRSRCRTRSRQVPLGWGVNAGTTCTPSRSLLHYCPTICRHEVITYSQSVMRREAYTRLKHLSQRTSGCRVAPKCHTG